MSTQDVTHKTCADCKESKPLDDFFNMAKRPDGKHYYCKTCCTLRRSIEGVRKRDAKSKISNRQQYRAKIEGVDQDGDITLERIYKRDKGICQLCKEPVTPKHASMDHKKPVVDGGGHTWDNVQLAHVRCNQIKNKYEIEILPPGSHLSPEKRKKASKKKPGRRKRLSSTW